MKESFKAALLSGLVLPGLGQIYLKRHLRGIILMLSAVGGFGYPMGKAAISAFDGLQKIPGPGTVDTAAIVKLAASAAAGASHEGILLFATGCWLFSIIDAYRLGTGRGREGAP